VVKSPKSLHGEPKYPYTNIPGVLRKVLQAIPGKPKPVKLDPKLVVSWGCAQSVTSNLRGALLVLKKIGLIATSYDPTALYVEYMNRATGPAALGAKIRDIYSEIFNASHSPQSENDETLEQLFNVHAGGSENLVRLQMQTFKALCDSATFTAPATRAATTRGEPTSIEHTDPGGGHSGPSLPPVKIDLHIHLPENKTTREYEAIIQDIAKYIYGRKDHGRE
jgi:hypothetical protein